MCYVEATICDTYRWTRLAIEKENTKRNGIRGFSDSFQWTPKAAALSTRKKKQQIGSYRVYYYFLPPPQFSRCCLEYIYIYDIIVVVKSHQEIDISPPTSSIFLFGIYNNPISLDMGSFFFLFSIFFCPFSFVCPVSHRPLSLLRFVRLYSKMI